MQYKAISRDGSVIGQSSSSYILARKIKNYLTINRLKDSRLYYASMQDLERFIRQGGSSNEISVRKMLKGRYLYVALSKSHGKRLLQGNTADELAIEVCEYLKKREEHKPEFLEVESLIMETKNVSNFEIIKFNSRSKDAKKFERLTNLSGIKVRKVAYELNSML